MVIFDFSENCIGLKNWTWFFQFLHNGSFIYSCKAIEEARSKLLCLVNWKKKNAWLAKKTFAFEKLESIKSYQWFTYFPSLLSRFRPTKRQLSWWEYKTIIYLPSMIVKGSSTLGRRILGPKTVARFWTLILLTPEYDCTSSKNLLGVSMRSNLSMA